MKIITIIDPATHAVVPIEADHTMRISGFSKLNCEVNTFDVRMQNLVDTYQAMLSASPAPADAGEVVRKMYAALEAVADEQIQSDINDLENKTLGTCLPITANLTLPTRIACQEAIDSYRALMGD